MNIASRAQLKFQMQNVLFFQSCELIQQYAQKLFFVEISVIVFHPDES